MSYMYPWAVDHGRPTIFERPYREPGGTTSRKTKKQERTEQLGKAAAAYHQGRAMRPAAPGNKKKK